VTNNSGKSRAAYAAKMQEMGFALSRLGPADVLSSSFAAAHFLSSHPEFDAAAHRAFVLGDSGIAEEMALLGIQTVDARQSIGSAPITRDRLVRLELDPAVRAVVVGIDDQLTYAKVAHAAALLRDAAVSRLFVATNRDATLPTGVRDLPGAGACVAAVETASGRSPINVGKPARLLFDLAASALALDAARCLMIGDRLDTDIAFAAAVGMDSLMVESGISTREDIEQPGNSIRPTYIARDVNALLTG
jgi:4-nitrophenyl phosphatase